MKGSRKNTQPTGGIEGTDSRGGPPHRKFVVCGEPVQLGLPVPNTMCSIPRVQCLGRGEPVPGTNEAISMYLLNK